jgi:hypothetical protein
LSGTSEIADYEQLNVYPNPADNMIFIPHATGQTVSALFTLDGRKVADITGTSFNTSALAEGVYVLHSAGKEGLGVTDRVIIAH